MQISRFLFSLFLLAFFNTAFTQDSIRTNVRPDRIDNNVTLLIREGDLLIREQYRDWRGNFWFFWTDTVTPAENGMLTGHLGTIDPTAFTWVESCDPVIRKIRNETRMHYLEYGTGDELTGLSLDTEIPGKPTHDDETALCPDAFEVKALKWQSLREAALRQELEHRTVRREWVASVIEKNEVNLLDSFFIASFLNDFSRNAADGSTFLILAEYRTDMLQQACETLSERQFSSVRQSVFLSTQRLDTGAAVKRIKASRIKGKRNRKLVREMK